LAIISQNGKWKIFIALCIKKIKLLFSKFRKLKVDRQLKDSKHFLGVWLHKEYVARDDFLLNLCFKLNDQSKSFSSKKSTDFKTSGWGWNEFLDLDKLFDRSLEYLGENSTLKLVAEVKLISYFKIY
jgi:hypothetical protein